MRFSLPASFSREATPLERNRRTALVLVAAIALMMAMWVVVAWVRN